MGDSAPNQISTPNMNRKLSCEIKGQIDNLVIPHIQEVLKKWEEIYGLNSEPVVTELTAELVNDFQKFFETTTDKLSNTSNKLITRIDNIGKETLQLEKALGLDRRVAQVSDDLPLVQIEEQLLSLLESYQDLKDERLEEYFSLQKEEKDLCTLLDMKTPLYELDAAISNEDRSTKLGLYVPTCDDMTAFKERISHLKDLKEQLEYDFEEAKGKLRELMEECGIPPFNQQENFAFGEADLPISKKNLKRLKDSVDLYTKRKEDLIDEAKYLRGQIKSLTKKLFKDPLEVQEFLEDQSFTEAVIGKLKNKLKSLKEERKSKLKQLIPSSRAKLVEWWDRCCYSEAQREEFQPFKVTRLSEEVLDMHELEIENLENFYNNHKQIFVLAEQHSELWERLLDLENRANNKERLFNNRGGCLLKEEKERKLIQKKLPAVTSKLMALLDSYKEETGKDFLYNGRPLEMIIEMKEQERENFKYTEKVLRKEANADKLMMESRMGTTPTAGVKRRAVMVQQNPKTRRMETATASSSASTSSNENLVTVRKAADVGQDRQYLTTHIPSRTPVRTPSDRSRRHLPPSSTPTNGTH